MKYLKILTTLALGVLASSSGVVQVQAANIVFLEDFATKEVANFNDFKQTFSVDTYDLGATGIFTWEGSYKFDSCPTAFVVNAIWEGVYRINNTGTFYSNSVTLPDLPCTTTFTPYVATASFVPNNLLVEAIINDDANYVRIFSQMLFDQTAATNGRVLTLRNYEIKFMLEYDFNTTYLFNYFLSDQNFVDRVVASASGSSLVATQGNYLNYVFTTAGNDTYFIVNSTAANIGTTRKKYAIDSDEQFFRGENVGAQFRTYYDGNDTITFGSTGRINYSHRYNYFYLNVANVAQAIVDAPLITFTEESCSGGFLDINVACYVNNAIAYLVNDAPVISDAFTLLNTGIELAAQTFGIIGSFTDDNVFGYLILVGFGFIAVKWFLKNDE